MLQKNTNIPVRGPPIHDIVLSIKTGATVIHARVPIQLLTFVPNFPNTLVYSDLKSKIGDIPVADALARVSADEAGSSLKYWRQLQEVQAQNGGLSDSDGKMGDLNGGWALDKFKNVRNARSLTCRIIESQRQHRSENLKSDSSAVYDVIYLTAGPYKG